MEKLDELGIADSTIVVYSSDHSEMLGSQTQEQLERYKREPAAD